MIISTRKSISLTVFLILIFHVSLFAQKFTQFEYLKGKNAQVYALDNYGGEESFLLVFQFNSHFDLVFLNDQMVATRIQRTDNLPPNLRGKGIQSIMNYEEELHILLAAPQQKNEYRSILLKVDKTYAEYEIQELPEGPPEMLETLNSSKVNLVKIFQYDNKFFKIWVNVKSSELHVLCYAFGDEPSVNFHSYENPLVLTGLDNSKNFGRSLGRRMVVPIPIITDAREASMISNAKEEKIYMFGDEMLISVENEEGYTDLISLNTETWEISGESYPVAGFKQDEPNQNSNSFIYGGYLYQVLYNSEGLRLSKRDFETNEIVQEKIWKNEAEFYENFPLRRMRQFRGSSLHINEDPNIWQHFRQSLAILIQPEESYERLIIGSHRYTNQRRRDAINALGAVAAVGSQIGASGFFGADVGIVVDPFESLNLLIDATYYFREGRIFQGDCYFNPQSFKFSTVDIKIARWERVMERVDREIQEQRIQSISLFEKDDKIYFGYWRKKTYYLLEF